MRDTIVMWRSTKMAVLAALCAAVYAALLIPFKAIPLIPGFTELRPANVVPVVAGLLFGPAAAWGCAFGNLIGDFFGTIGPGSFFGFLGNFVFAYVPYRLWQSFLRGRPATGAAPQAPAFLVVAVLASMACGVVIGWGVDLLGLVPYHVLTAVIVLNNSVAAVVLGLIVLPLVQPRAHRLGLLYQDVMAPEDYASGRLAPLGVACVVVGAVGGSFVALNMHLGGEAGPLLHVLPATWSLKYVAGACALLIGVGCNLFTRLSGARQEDGVGAGMDAKQAAAPALEVCELAFTYPLGARQALRVAGLRQQTGEFRVLMGRTGAGKSTLCRCLSGVIPQLQTGDFRGTVRLFGGDIAGVPVYRLAPLVGCVFQDFESQLLTGSVEAEVAFPLENAGVGAEEMSRRVAATLKLVGMWELRERDPALLSGGEKQRLALAAALAPDPDVLVLDEPTTDLDARGRGELLARCADLRAAGKTLLVAEHDTELAAQADVLTVLHEGEVAHDGPPADLLCDPPRTWELGLRPLDMPALFHALGRPERPLTVAAAAAALEAAPFDEAAWEHVVSPWVPGRHGSARTPCGAPQLAVSDVWHVYPDGLAALRGVSLEVHEGEFVAILGRNGCGKTTLARHLNGLLQPTRGTVTVRGLNTSKVGPAQLAQTVGYLFQDPDHQIFAPTVAEEVALGPRNLGLSGERLERRVAWALETVGVAAEAACDPFTLTKGERQQVALASILAMQPPVIVFDEPTTGLDGRQQELMMQRLRHLNEVGRTIIIITHCAWAAAAYAHRTILLADGAVIADGPTRELFGDPGLLQRAGQTPPPITRLCRQVWGKTVLSVDEAVRCLRPPAPEGADGPPAAGTGGAEGEDAS